MSASATSKRADLGQIRDSVESVYVAIVLAFVLRAFLIEAFVIPTGSMASTLYGEHYELTCPACGYEYAYGPERDSKGRMMDELHGSFCPNCGYPYIPSRWGPSRVLPSGGDRVLVLKYLYDFAPPRPWDVVVFRNPQNNRENYIKRLIGLPGESIEIVQGDIFVSQDGGRMWSVRRKTAAAQEAMWRLLHDSDYPPDEGRIAELGVEPPCWKADEPAGPWNLGEYGGRVFAFGGGAPAKIEFHPGRAGFYPVNAYNDANTGRLGYNPQSDLCTDWKLSCVWTVREDRSARLSLLFESYGDRYQAEFHRDGRLRLLHQRRDAAENAWDEWASGKVAPFEVGQGREIALINVDYRVSVWVDGRCVLESTDEQVAGPGPDSAEERLYRLARRRATTFQQQKDNRQAIEATEANLRRHSAGSDEFNRLHAELKTLLAKQEEWRREADWFGNPGISATAQGGRAELRHVRLQRDVYYTASAVQYPTEPGSEIPPDFDYARLLRAQPSKSPNRWIPHPQGRGYLAWGSMGNPIHLRDYPGQNDLDEFFCLGDNSTQSHDGRSWVAAAPSLRLFDRDGNPQYQLGTVPRYNILGRAMMVYWSAGFRVPILNWPIVPNVGRMRLVR